MNLTDLAPQSDDAIVAAAHTRAASRPRRSKLRSFTLGSIALGGSCLLAAFICEAALWVFAPIPYWEFIDWSPEGHIRARPTPNQIIRNATGHEIRINKYGFRGPDYGYQKAPGTLRIEVFGGSAGFNFHASGREKTWAGSLERKLAARLGLPVEVINLALPGFDSFNSKINYLCFGRAFEPDAIIVYHTWNDLKAFRSLERVPYRPAGHTGNKPLWQQIARMTQLGRRGHYVRWNLLNRHGENTYSKLENTDTGVDSPIDEKAFAWERRNFVDLVNFAKRDRVLPIMVSQAPLGIRDNLDDDDIRLKLGSVPSMIGMTLPVMAQTWSRVSSIIEEVARTEGAIFVDGYSAVPHDFEHFRDHVHLHDSGCEALAEAIANTLIEDSRFLELANRVKSSGRAKSVAFMPSKNPDRLAEPADDGFLHDDAD